MVQLNILTNLQTYDVQGERNFYALISIDIQTCSHGTSILCQLLTCLDYTVTDERCALYLLQSYLLS
jgi:hypothetical protein